MAVLILILLRVDFLSILLQHTLVITLPRPIGRTAGENVITELLKIKCLPCMYYVCVSKSQIKSLHFAVNSVFRKIFLIKSHDAARKCMSF